MDILHIKTSLASKTGACERLRLDAEKLAKLRLVTHINKKSFSTVPFAKAPIPEKPAPNNEPSFVASEMRYFPAPGYRVLS